MLGLARVFCLVFLSGRRLIPNLSFRPLAQIRLTNARHGLTTGTPFEKVQKNDGFFNERSSCKVERLAMKRFKFHRQESFFLYFFLLLHIKSTEFLCEKEEVRRSNQPARKRSS